MKVMIIIIILLSLHFLFDDIDILTYWHMDNRIGEYIIG